jgi:hypothetical protein
VTVQALLDALLHRIVSVVVRGVAISILGSHNSLEGEGSRR